ncbi:MAG: F0F1 ATP synthase subunit A [Candidatus Paceibacterota bacterium]|jgi:F-type H+-transporting ATPase subunit a
MHAISLIAEPIFFIGSFPVTNALAVSALVTAILCGAGIFFRRKIALIPGLFQNLIEMLMEQLLGLMSSVLGDEQAAEKYFPLIATIFIAVLTANWLGLFPGVGSIGLYEGVGAHASFIPLLRSPSADLNFTLALAIIAVLSVNLAGIFALGFFKHVGKFFNFKNPIHFFVGILELVSEMAKMISFSFRLFGNIFAGEVLLIIIGFLAPLIVPLPFMFLELFAGFIQAFVFAMLTLVFVTIAIAEPEH